VIKLETDVIVAAAGLSGLAASVAAAELGAKVITFEKNISTGGAANMGISPLAVGSRHQRMAGYNYTPEEIFEKHMHYVHWKADARLVMEYYRKTASTIEWLENMGIQFVFEGNTKYTPVRMKAFASAEQVRHPVAPAPGFKVAPRVAAAMTKGMTEYFLDLGGDLRLQTPVTSVIMENCRAVGVRAKSSDGEQIEAYADAVILACGGYGDNPKMIKDILGFEWGKDLFSFRIPGNVGDGLRMAWEAGAGKEPSIMELMYQIPDNLNHFTLEGAFRQPILWVNKLGRRFIPEDIIGNTGITGNAIAYQPFRTCFAIMDGDTLAYYKARGVDFPGVQGEDVFDHFDEAAQKALDEGYKYFFAVDSIEELCEKTGIDEAGFKETVQEYNECCTKGHDVIMGKDHAFLRPVKKPKFYALQCFPGGYGTLGGVRTDYKMQVLTEDYKVIPGLYSVGTDAMNICGDTYPFILPGNTMAFCLNSGRMAGENAVSYLNSLTT
jgi:fumarate reductase flavoprotein subunit